MSKKMNDNHLLIMAKILNEISGVFQTFPCGNIEWFYWTDFCKLRLILHDLCMWNLRRHYQC